jgi:histidinol-phosphatase
VPSDATPPPTDARQAADLDADLALALELADRADALTTERFRALDLTVESKPDLSPVTDADRAVEALLRDVLARRRPGDAMIGEEYGESGAGDRQWIVDPIDGTKNYVRGAPVWATLIALRVRGEVVLGVASAPALGRRWWAARGRGAYADGQPIQVSKVSDLADAHLSYSSLTGWEKLGRLEGLLDLSRRVWRTRAFGDFWSHVLVAEGVCDLAAEPEVSLWDLAALQVIVEEAGGRFTDLGGIARPDGGSAVSTNGHLHDQVLELLRPAVQAGEGDCAYDWEEDWTQPHGSPLAQIGHAHPGVVVTADGEIITFHPGDPTVLVYAADGTLVRSWVTDLVEGHGLTLAREGDTEVLWIVDNGTKVSVGADGQYASVAAPHGGRAVKMTLDGTVLLEIGRPPSPAYEGGTPWAPTSVAVDEECHGGNGDVWLADGYGQGVVHRYDSQGTWLSSFDGSGSQGGAFNCPHAVFIDRRRAEPELYIADRGNAQVQVFGLDGEFRRVVGQGFLNSPSAFATDGRLLIIGELYARLTVCDESDNFVCYIGENGAAVDRAGWPNSLDDAGKPIAATALLEPGRFNSPHGLAVGADRRIYVAEFLLGGRLIRLTPGTGT